MTDLALYDMDRTITRRATFPGWLFFFARTQAPWRLCFLPLLPLIGLICAVRLISRKRAKELAQLLFLGARVNPDILERATQAHAQAVLRQNCHAQARQQIAEDRAQGRRIIMVTASNHYYVAPIARLLGLAPDDVIATQSIYDAGGRLTWRLTGPNCYGAAKPILVAERLKYLGLERGHVRFYSDHHSDQPLFLWADEAIAVNPDPRLRRMAGTQGWRILHWS